MRAAMTQKKSVKKVYQTFVDFKEEEKWLQEMLEDGWMLASYDSEDLEACQYVFHPVHTEEENQRIYKIDYRTFGKKEQFEEYKELFEDAKWTLLSKSKWYSKHIFYTEQSNPNREIFSDQQSYEERNKRKQQSYMMSILALCICIAVTIVLYAIYQRTAFLGASLVMIVTSIKLVRDYVKTRALVTVKANHKSL
ncbi:DUF2812 domain-containing protein [Priestia koreensis]